MLPVKQTKSAIGIQRQNEFIQALAEKQCFEKVR